MRMPLKSLTIVAAIAIGIFVSNSTASARGGAMQNIMSSHGYQRALKESRERYRQNYYGQPYVQAPRVYPGRKWRHRHWRHRR